MKIYTMLLFIMYNSVYSQWTSINNDSLNYKTNFFDFAVIDSNIFAATNKGVFLSTNLGLNWTGKNNGISMNLKSTWPMKIASTDRNLFILVTTPGYPSGNIYHSSNHGTNWIKLNLTDSLGLRCIEKKDSTLYIISNKKLYYTNSNGMNWEQFNTDFTSDPIRNLWIKNHFFLLTVDKQEFNQGQFFSSNVGIDWTDITSQLKKSHITSFATNDNVIVIGTDTNGVFVSKDNGISWSQTKILNITKDEYVNVICVIGTNLFIGCKTGVYLSLDDGKRWKLVSNGVPIHDVHALIYKEGYLFVGCVDGGSFRAKISDLIALVGVKEGLNLHKGNNPIITPNPAEDYIDIDLGVSFPQTQESNIRIFNALGECVLTASDARQRKRIDLSALPAGMYFLMIQSGGQSVTEQFAIVR